MMRGGDCRCATRRSCADDSGGGDDESVGGAAAGRVAELEAEVRTFASPFPPR
eukprot:COSAG01_NODE_34430_length_547_cov_16.218750_1_plen_52_part_10